MSRWAIDIASPPPKAYEAVEAFHALIVASAGLVPTYLAANGRIAVHDEPVPTATYQEDAARVVITEHTMTGGPIVEDSTLLTVRLHVRAVCPKHQASYRAWHADVHAAIAQAVVGQGLTLAESNTGWPIRQLTEPSRPEYYADTDTRESFVRYAITLESIQP